MPKREASLFHPKKKKPSQKPPIPAVAGSSSTQSPTKPPLKRPRPPPPPPKSDDDEFKAPEGAYQEFTLLSSSMKGWKYDGMKFDSRKLIDVFTWTEPVKLNRKDLRRDQPVVIQKAVGPMLGPDGRPVIGPDGKNVMMDADGRPIHATDPSKEKPKGPNARKKFQKKTRQVFVVPEEQRQLRREERYPWILEDSGGQETWQGQLDDVTKAATHAFFMPAANNVFKFVPSHRWYKFQKKLKHSLPTDTLDVETAYSQSQKRDPQIWLAQRTGRSLSAATTSMFKAETDGHVVTAPGSLVHSAGQSLAPGGRRLRTVDTGADNLFGDDDDEAGKSAKKRRQKDLGGDGDLDEVEFEEEFADDEEMPNLDQDEDEAKEAEERLKREYKSANKQREGDESDEDDEGHAKSKQERAMQKLIRKREGNDAYDSDDDKNPYASSDESEEEEPVLPTGQTIQEQHEQQQQELAAHSTAPKPNGVQQQPAKVPVPGVNRATSPSLGGHSIVAKRATSPKAPGPKVVTSSSRASSPLAGRIASPTSPVSNKRKAPDDGSPSPTSPNGAGSPSPSHKKRKPTPVGELDESMLVEWLKSTPNATTKDCIARFKPYVHATPDGKNRLTTLVKQVARVKEGYLVLKSSSAVPSRASSPTS